MSSSGYTTGGEVVDVLRLLLSSRGAFDVRDGLFVEDEHVAVLVTPEPSLADRTDIVDLLVTVRVRGGAAGLATTPVSLVGPTGRLLGELDVHGRARLAGVSPGRAALEIGPLHGLAPVVDLRGRRRPIDGLSEPVDLVSRELPLAAQTGGRVGPVQHWRSLDGALSIELAESQERRLLLTVSRRATGTDPVAVRVRWVIQPREQDGGDRDEAELVTPLAAGFGGRRASVRYDLGSAEMCLAFGIANVDSVPLGELTEADVANAMRHGPYGSALRSWEALVDEDTCPPPVAERITAELRR